MVDEPCYVLNLYISEVLLMEWIDQMKMAMETLIDACNRNRYWDDCSKCPFDDYCTVLERHGMGVPDEWKIED